MLIRAAVVGCVLAAMPALLGACASEPSDDESNSVGRSVPDTDSSSNGAEGSVPEKPETAGRPSKKPNEPSEQATIVKVIDTDFRPVRLRVVLGAVVEWKQVGDQPHSVTAADGSFDSNPECGPLDSDDCLGAGDRFTHTFEQVGKFTYYCRVHGLPDGTGMTGTIVVR